MDGLAIAFVRITDISSQWLKMSAKDKLHDLVKTVLENDAWVITDEPLYLYDIDREAIAK
jgi:XisH protein